MSIERKKINMSVIKTLDRFDLWIAKCPDCKKEFITSINGIMSCKKCGHDFIFDSNN